MIPKLLVDRFGPSIAKVVFWGVLVLILLALLSLGKCAYDRSAKTEIALGKGQAGAAQASGRDAVDTVGNQAASEDEADRITEENEDAIRNAQGADAPVDPAARDAGLASLCRRAAYRGSKQCLQHAASQ